MSVVTAPPVSPYKGLAAFRDSELDALFFFGREHERAVIAANLLASRLTVLYGESGVGKSSLLAAAVLRDLREAAPDAQVLMHTTWSGEPPDFAAEFAAGGEGYLILDQFEEYFLYHDDALLETLPELLATTRVNVLIALREDALARLDAFKARIPGVFANQLRLEHLDVQQARRAILGPLARWEELTGEHVDAEPALVEAVVAQVAVDGGRIEAPYLQLVLERVWEAERDAGSWLLRRSTLDALGGAAAIVRNQFHGALEALPPAEQDVAAAMFEHLVTPSGTKIAHRVQDLAEYAQVDEVTLRRVLAELTRDRIVHSVDGSDRYEIFHDVLAEPVSSWRLQRRLERERTAARRRQRRLHAGIVVALVALAVVAGLAVWAFVERGKAQAQARRAHAQELEATALQRLTVDPRQSLRNALTAALLAPGPESEGVLRQSLIADRLRRTERVGGAVRAVAWSPDGRFVAAAAPRGRILVVDAATGRRLRVLEAGRAVAALGFEADGRTLVATRSGTGARAWDVASGAPVAAPGRLLAATDVRGRTVLVRARGRLAASASHVLIARLGVGAAPLAALVSEPGGRRRVWLFDRTGKLLRILPERGIADVSYAPNGRLLATASADGNTTVWDPRTGRRVRVLRDLGTPVVAVAFSPDGTQLATGGQDGGVRVWTVATGQRLFYFLGHTNPVTAVAWSPDGRVVASASTDRTVRLWGVARIVTSGTEVALLAGARDAVRAIAFSPNGGRLATGSDDGDLRFWDASPEQALTVLARAPGGFDDAVWLGSPGAAAAAARDAIHFVPGIRTAPYPGATQLATVGKQLYALTRGGSVVDVLHRRVLVEGPVSAFAVAPDTTVAVAHGTEIALGSERYHAPGGVDRLAFSSDGRLLASADLDGTARIFDVRDHKLVRVLRGHHAAVTDVAFSHDGTLLVTSSRDTHAIVWSVATGRRLHVLRGHFGPVSAAAFSPDGRWVATAGPISAGLWPTSTGQLLFYLRGDTGRLTGVAFSADGSTILSASEDGTVRTYRCTVCGALPALERAAEQRLRS